MADPRPTKAVGRRSTKAAAPIAPFASAAAAAAAETLAHPTPREAVESLQAAAAAAPEQAGETLRETAAILSGRTVDTVTAAAEPVVNAATTATEAVAEAATDAVDTSADTVETVTAATADATGRMAAASADATAAVAAAAPDPTEVPPAALAATNPLKGYVTMATAAPANAQAMFVDMNDRAKGMLEKTSRMGEEMVEFTKGNVEAIVASARVAAKGSEAMVQDAAEYSKKSFEQATAAFKSLSSAKSPTEMFQLQSDFAKSSFDSAVAEASKNSEAMLKLMGEVFQPLSNRYAVASEKMKATTTTY